MNISQANPRAEYLQLKSEIDAAVLGVLNGGHYILGPEVNAFEKEFAAAMGAQYALGVASGTDAVYLALRCAGVDEHCEVITVSHTAVATVAAIDQCGATPVLVDIDSDTYTLDPAKLEEAITPKTRAVIAVHLYGCPANLEPILEICERHGILLVEDCAQAHGAEYHGRVVSAWGHIAAFSFYPTKNLGAIGDGGMIVTNRADLYERAVLLRQYGWRKRYISEISGINSRLDEIQAAILRVKLTHLGEFNLQRKARAAKYTALLKDVVVTPIEPKDVNHVFHLYVIRHPRRDALKAFLQDLGIGTAIHYPLPVHLQPAYLDRLGLHGKLPVTEIITGEILSLPLYPQLQMSQVEEVAEAILKFK